MTRLALLILPLLALSACGKSETTVATDGEGNKVTVVKDGAGDTNPEVKVTTKDGSVTIATGADAAKGLPLGLALYPGAKITANAAMTGSGAQGGTGGMVAFETSAKPADVIAFYKKEAIAKGMEVKGEATMGDSATIAAEGKAKDGFYISAGPGGSAGVTAVSVIAGTGQ